MKAPARVGTRLYANYISGSRGSRGGSDLRLHCDSLLHVLVCIFSPALGLVELRDLGVDVDQRGAGIRLLEELGRPLVELLRTGDITQVRMDLGQERVDRSGGSR